MSEENRALEADRITLENDIKSAESQMSELLNRHMALKEQVELRKRLLVLFPPKA